MYREKLLHEIALEIYKNGRITCLTDDDDDDDDLFILSPEEVFQP